MNIELSDKQFRLLLDLVYTGNWVLNSERGDDRIGQYDEIESKLFAKCAQNPKLRALLTYENGVALPSQAYEDGGIHDAIDNYMDVAFYRILASELVHRDMDIDEVTPSELSEYDARVQEYLSEFEINGVDNLTLDS